MRSLTLFNAVLVAAILLHSADHVRQERGIDSLTTEVRLGGTMILLLALGSLALARRGHPRSPLVSTVVGFYVALGVTASHFAPHWSAFSDPYADLNLGALSWAAAATEVLAGLALGTVGLLVLRREQARRRLASEVATG